jgi:hypothetical protein
VITLNAGCTKILNANFDQESFIVGSSPQGEFSGAPQGDLILSQGEVEIVGQFAGAMTKNLGMFSVSSTARLIPAMHPAEPRTYWLNFDGLLSQGVIGITAWDKTDPNNPLWAFRILMSGLEETHIGFAYPTENNPEAGTGRSLGSGPRSGVHHITIRFDRSANVIYALAKFIPEGPVFEVTIDDEDLAPITRITEIEILVGDLGAGFEHGAYQIDNIVLQYR